MSYDDIVRLVALLLAFLVGGASIAVSLAHWRTWRRLRAAGRPRAGLLPLHVALISLSYVLLTYALAMALVDSFGRELSWRIYLYAVGWAVGLVALGVVGRVVGRRRACLTSPAAPARHAAGSKDDGAPPRP